ncbi:MAG: transketolase [Gammaproteobacteria bacterium]
MSDIAALANCIRALSMDAVQRANSGHPGMPMGFADVAAVLFSEFMKFNPQDPQWADRDRFVLSAGHGSMLLYSLLHLLGYPQMTVEEIQNFRRRGSKTPGHPEYGCAPGVETTTGPLGQGFANAVGMAIAERVENARFGDSIVDHRVYVAAGDGCLSEGISHEAASLAGHLSLSKLAVLFDDNGITIDGKTSLSVSDDHLKRFAACGWHADSADGHSPEDIRRALADAQNSDKPSFIAFRTVIGFGAPNKAGSEKAHGAPLGEDEIAAARKQLNWPHPPFAIPDSLRAKWREIGARGADEYAKWQKRIQNAPAETRAEWTRWRERKCGAETDAAVDSLKKELAENPPTIATRKASEKTLSVLADTIPGFIGGSADLTGSNNTKVRGQRAISARDFGGGYIHYGVREHAMAAAMNGMALHGLLPYGGTFLAFSDYCRPAIRLSALTGAQVIYVMTHDSIGLGEDGPTHQPVEHLAALRAIPNLSVYRPADATETAECWRAAISDFNRPSILALSRQNVPPVRREYVRENLCAKGAYLLHSETVRDLTILASGAEVATAMQAAELLLQKNLRAAVVSVPCREKFEMQPDSYRKEVLGDAPRFVVEAATAFGWERYATGENHIFAMPGFGESAPAADLFAHFGFAPETIAAKIGAILGGGE